MKYTNDELRCSFELPDRLTVRQQINFWTKVNNLEDDSKIIGSWEGGKSLIEDWACEAIPSLATSLDEMFESRQALIVNWVGGAILKHIAGLDNIPKN